MTHVLGLTGGIASGKSTVSRYFKNLGYPVIDADIIAREIMEPDEPSYNKVVDYFGQNIVNEDRSINRQQLGEIVFSNNEQLRFLNNLVQQDIFNEIIQRKKALSGTSNKMIVLDIPLLYEMGYEDFVDEVMLVYSDYTTQLNRLIKRDQLTEAEAVQRIEAQAPLDSKKEKADVVIDNNGSVEETLRQVDDWLTKKGYSSPL